MRTRCAPCSRRMGSCRWYRSSRSATSNRPGLRRSKPMATILLVEDEPNISAIILFKLRREGHEVLHVGTVAAARDAGATWDLVLLDSSLPGEDPLALLADLRAHTPVVVMTESRDDITPDVASSLGAAAIVRKPFKPTVLARLVAEIARVGKGDADHSAGNMPGGLMGTMTAEAAR